MESESVLSGWWVECPRLMSNLDHLRLKRNPKKIGLHVSNDAGMILGLFGQCCDLCEPCSLQGLEFCLCVHCHDSDAKGCQDR